MLRPALLIAAVLALASCATLTEEECRAGDWFSIGVADGAEGRPAGRIEAHRRACAKAGIAPDAAEWLRGRERGLREYCVPARAYRVGRTGWPIAEGCTPAELAAMAPAYDWGREWYRFEERINEAQGDIREIDRQLAALPADSPNRGVLLARRGMLTSRVGLLELQQLRYATWP